MKFCSVSDCGTPARSPACAGSTICAPTGTAIPASQNALAGADPTAEFLLEQFPEPSPRSRTRLARAARLTGLIRDHFNIEGALEDSMRHATRPNGSMNF